jgi:hypothetical protein
VGDSLGTPWLDVTTEVEAPLKALLVALGMPGHPAKLLTWLSVRTYPTKSQVYT